MNSDFLFACEIKVGYTRKRKSPLSEKDKHIQQFLRESNNTVELARHLDREPIFSLALGCDLPKNLFNQLCNMSKKFMLINLVPSDQNSETCYPKIQKIKGYNLRGLKDHFNSFSQKNWTKFEKYNRLIKKLLNSKSYRNPRSAAEDIIVKVFKKDPNKVKLQNLFSSLSVGRSLSKW